MKYITTIDDIDFEVEILNDHQVTLNNQVYEIDFEEISSEMIYSIIVNGKSYEVNISEDENEWYIFIQGTMYKAAVIDEREKRLREASGELALSSGEYTLVAPMPGLVVKVPVRVGKKVDKGNVLVILESMKMQNELRSPHKGTITEVNVKKGDRVEKREPLLVLDQDEDK
ncbi:MAG: biotin/lipoyl-binding protein [Anaerolineales bacterium]|jgi:biotin carboxyl carrier protein